MKKKRQIKRCRICSKCGAKLDNELEYPFCPVCYNPFKEGIMEEIGR